MTPLIEQARVSQEEAVDSLVETYQKCGSIVTLEVHARSSCLLANTQSHQATFYLNDCGWPPHNAFTLVCTCLQTLLQLLHSRTATQTLPLFS
jgi:hypothetical protein